VTSPQERALQSGPFGRVDPNLPQVFGRYLLVQRISRGGMGEIFLAKHGLAGFEKLAVIKKVLPHLAADKTFISRFVDEAQVAIKLQHVNVAQVFEVGRVGDEYFLALEYVEGRDLRRTLASLAHKRRRFPVDLALFVGREVANGLAYAHRRTRQDGASLNLVHCDISPPNVVVSFEGETKLIDFGIAKSALRGTATDPKMGFGKFGYMAPEQLIRGGVVDHRTDIYAAGVVLYELLTGTRLYEAGPEPDYRTLAKKVARGEHPMPSEVDPRLAPYDDLVATALRPQLDERYQSAAEFRDAIQQALVTVNPTISTDQLGAFMRDAFSDEMTAQRELHDRVASAQLADFQEAFHTQSIATISFAMSSPVLAGEAPPRPRHSRQQPAVQPPPATPMPTPVPGALAAASPAFDTATPPTGLIEVIDRHASVDDLADGTGTQARVHPPRRRIVPIVIGAGIALAIAVVAVAATRGGDAPAASPTVAIAPPPAVPPPRRDAIIVEPIEPAPAAPPVLVVEPPQPQQQQPQQQQRPSRRAKPPTARSRPVAAEEPKEVTKDLVTNTALRATRLYREYKARNGTRLDAEYNDLLVYLQYDRPLPERLKKLESFIARLHE
jgi:eukaryotic-like serine/threonine-protein kinase